jgi:hypothetical protein
MKLGIKVGLQKESLTDLKHPDIACCEVWFNIAKKNDYDVLFAALKARRIDVGLHFWGVLPDNTWTNIAYPDRALIKSTLALMQETIDIAARHGFQYVNIHPGMRCNVQLDLTAWQYKPISAPVDKNIAQDTCIENAIRLNDYAKKQGVVFTVETVPQRVANGMVTNTRQARLAPMNIYELPASTITKLAANKLWIANDFGHTAANIISNNKEDVWTFVYDFTKRIASQTRLIHLGFVIAPYNGVDFHSDLQISEDTDSVPNRNQIKKLLQLFKTRDDIWVLAEPEANHVENFIYAQTFFNPQ